jgi:hypothetical protein
MMTLLECAEKIRAIFSNPRTMEEARTEGRHFTRSRKMPFARLLEYLLHGSKGATQSVLNEFFQGLEEGIHMTQQALSKARTHFDHSPFLKAFYEVVNAEYNLDNDSNLPRRYGYKFLAVDGSVIPLPNLPGLKQLFGDVKGSPSARADIALDVLNDRIVEAEFGPLSGDERSMAKEHIRKLKDRIRMEDTVFLFDRGYPSKELIEAILQANAHFIMRVRRKFNLDVDAAPMGSSVIILDGIRVRVVKFILPSSQTETLIADLFDMEESVFQELYFLRWSVEEKYDVVKNKLELPNFTGRTANVLYQDFWISMLLANVASVAKAEADGKVQTKRAGKANQYQYQTNVNNAIASLRNRFANAVFCPDPSLRASRVDAIIREIAASVVPKRPDRNVPRKKARKAKYHHNKKSNV